MVDEIYFKSKKVADRSKFMHEFAYTLMEIMVDWAVDKGVNPVITETVTTEKEDRALSRVSVTHRQGRAFDIRSSGWGKGLIKDFIDTFNKLYGQYGAISSVDNKPRLIIHHDSGSGMHFHVQLARSYAVKIPNDLDKTA